MNALVGLERSPGERAAQLDLAAENVRWAADQAAPHGIDITIEAVNTFENGPYLVPTTRAAAAFIDTVDRPNVRIQWDAYHMQRMEGNLVRDRHRVPAADRPHPDRRLARPRRARHRRDQLPLRARRDRRARLRGLGRPRVQPDHGDHRGEPRAGCRRGARDGEGPRRLHRPRRHGQAHGAQPARGRARRSSSTTRTRASVDELAGARRDRRARARARSPSRPTSSILMLPDSPQVREVLDGDDGLLAGAREGSLVDRHEHDLAGRHARDRRPSAASAASAGSTRPSAAATSARARRRCRSWPAAATSDFARAKPLFEALGKTIVHVGPVGAGQVVKACNQVVVALTIEAVVRGARARLEGRRRPRDDHRGAERRPRRQQGHGGPRAQLPRARLHARLPRSTCTTRTSASRSQTAREYGVALPEHGGGRPDAPGAARRTAAATSTTPRC